MILHLTLFLGIITLGRCSSQLPSKLEIESSINRTIEEVERLMKSDPNLPRLSRKQIVDILENITSKDMKNFEESVEQMRSDYQRALMVVLPYNPKDSTGDDLRDLYTKPPMVQVIPDSDIMLPFASIQEESSHQNTINGQFDKYSEDSKNKFSSNEHKSHQNSYSNVQQDSNPERFTFNLDNIRQNSSEFEVIYSPTVPKSSTPSDADISSSTIPSTKSTVNILTSDQWTYYAPPSTTPRPPRTSKPPKSSEPTTVINSKSNPKKPLKITTKSKPFLPTVISAVPTSESYTRFSDSKTSQSPEKPKTSQSPEVITFDMSEMEMVNDAPPVPLYVTPMSSFPPKTSTTQINSTPMRSEVANLLAAIGLQPTPINNTSDDVNSLSESHVLEEDFTIPESNFIPNKFVGVTPISPESSSIRQQNTFESDQTDLRKGVNNLSPELQSLFQKFGLPVSGEEVSTTPRLKVDQKIVRPSGNSWESFKPFPTSEVKDEGMRDFLATFGLGVDNRNKKALKGIISTTETPSVIEAVPERMKGILENIGLITRSSKSSELRRTTVNPEKLHVFKPHETRISDEKQKERINELLDTVKLVQEGKANVTDVRNAANRLLMTMKTLQGGPDPVSLEDILQRYNEDIKKEVKRQETADEDLGDVAMSDSTDPEMSASDISESTMSPTATLPEVTSSDSSGGSSDVDGRVVNRQTTTEISISSSEAPNLDDLADSFGGTTAEPDPILPAPIRSGLYFLVDWNSFLEVGEEDRDKVNIRFAPKAGDRTRFISVKVP